MNVARLFQCVQDKRDVHNPKLKWSVFGCQLVICRLLPSWVNHHECIYCMDEFNSVFLFYRGVDNVDDLMAEIAEQQELAYEISDAISKPYGFNEEFDEVRIHQKVLTVSQMKSVVAALHTA